MSFDIVLWLVQDGIVNGAIYAALSLALLQAGKLPGTVYVLVGGGAIAAVLDIAVALRDKAPGRLPRILAVYVLLPLAMAGIAWWAAPRKLDMWIQVLIVFGLVVPLGPILYRVAYRPLASASVLVLFIISMAAHYVLTGLGLVFFGGEGLRSQAFSDAHFKLGVLNISAQSVLVVFATVLIMASLWLFFEHSIYGKALRATAINRVGARLGGIPAEPSGSLALTLAAFIGAVSGGLVAPITTIYYDTGFLIGLKGFVGAILGGMGSYPLAAIGAVGVGLLESFSSFWASAFKESIVFTIIIPVLVWRSLTTRHVEDEEGGWQRASRS